MNGLWIRMKLKMIRGPDLLRRRICGYYKDSFPVCFRISFHFHQQYFFSTYIVVPKSPESVCLLNCLLYIVTKYCMDLPIHTQWSSIMMSTIYYFTKNVLYIVLHAYELTSMSVFIFMSLFYRVCVTSAHAQLMQNWLLINFFLANHMWFMSSLWQTADGEALREPQRAQWRSFRQSN